MREKTRSEIAMYRAIIALAWADHRLTDEEQTRVLAYIEHNETLSDAQREQLADDLRHPVRMDDVWPQITEVRDRAHVINVADAIFWEDGTLCHSEKEVYEKIKAAHMATLDIDVIRDDIAALRRELLADREEFQRELHEMRGPIGRTIHYLTTLVDKVI